MKQSEIDYWITSMLRSYPNISDLNLTVGKPLQVEAAGILMPVQVQPPVLQLTPFQTEVFALNLIGNDKRLLADLLHTGSCDLSYSLGDEARFRVNIFSQKGYYSIVLRKLETTIPTIEGMEFPEIFHKIAMEKNGLVLFTGSTGSGKTTSLAALLHKINHERQVHVVTLEDPIEYVHPQEKATFNQRELGKDFDSFASGVRAALRQAPKVILVGEMRDRETLETAIAAAETGHLVFSTLHTIDAGQAINRILGFYELEEQPQVRNRLIDTLRWVVGQRLVPRVLGGRIAVIEILCISLRIKDLILHGERGDEKTFYKVIEAGSAVGMRTFDQHIVELYDQGIITEKTAMSYCTQRTEIARKLDTIKAARGEATSTLSGLAMEEEEQDRRW
ncbi:MAG: PilT/PilU family type 4a pilus ATPase [Proteobacteria bacterium]|nr:PilT/PilU family type 4a pilus ATPase [Desulfocapsa sp.]MBU3946303.1 PilT/PilU family type 4a pilus ATPase [Pseudomonadota bacterium]MCG2742530.1 PilT/PilU family type 4a pilus ATPase [Desulfobacteraceae bacterium]MDO8946387.1 PilT/PilU family type 4a pilus ATPase [Desulfocapsaceae bacterium]MBU3982532.1 PilT/PilU family type 4a pilus ATPase [Pseudomonadota bacterium]